MTGNRGLVHSDCSIGTDNFINLQVGLSAPFPNVNTRSKDKKSKSVVSNHKKIVSSIPKNELIETPSRAPEAYIRSLNIGLNFSHDVIEKCAPDPVRYENALIKDFYKCPKNILGKRQISKKGHQGRHNAVGDPSIHIPCTFPISPRSEELRRTKVFHAEPYLKKSFQKEEKATAQNSETVPTKPWDEYILSKLSADTANLIVNKHVHVQQRDRLQQRVLSEESEEISSNAFKASQFIDVEPIRVKRKHGIDKETVKESHATFAVSESDLTMATSNDDIAEEKNAPIEEERIPAYLGKPLQRNYMEKFMTKSLWKRENSMDLEEEKYVSSGYNKHKLLSGVEPFTECILQGQQPVHCPGSQSKIVFDGQTHYKRDLVTCYPQNSDTWGPKVAANKRNVPVRGHRPWQHYPKLIITTYQRQILSNGIEEGTNGANISSGHIDSVLESDEVSHTLLVNALSQWRTTWYIDNKWRDSNLESIVADMKDISAHVRITAAIACGAALGYRDDWDLSDNPNDKISSAQDNPVSGYRAYSPSEQAASSKRSLAHVVAENLVNLLNDEVERVQIATSVTLLAIGISEEKAKQVLLTALSSPSTMAADTWAAVQCLAMENITERIVVDKLTSMIHSIDPLVRVTATRLLVRLSQSSDVILFMVADELNNRRWINRYMACKVIQKIHTPLNNDILHKLLTLMWSDYSEDIRSVAAQTIGVKGHGQFLHEELICRLRKGSEFERVDALNRIIQLQMMTGRMKSVFLKCFTDDHVSVRYITAVGAGKLKFSDPDVIEGIIACIADDHSPKVKAAAIEALADIGIVNDRIIEQLLWSAQYQQDAQVRAAACLALAMLKVDREDVVTTLRDRLTADADNLVKKASTEALQMLGLKPEKDASLIIAIREAVKKLGSKDAILASIISMEQSTEEHEFSDRQVLCSRETFSAFDAPLNTSRSNVASRRKTRSRKPSRQVSNTNNEDIVSPEWPEARLVLKKTKEMRAKKEKIQAVLDAHEPKAPPTRFLWRQSLPEIASK